MTDLHTRLSRPVHEGHPGRRGQHGQQGGGSPGGERGQHREGKILLRTESGNQEAGLGEHAVLLELALLLPLLLFSDDQTLINYPRFSLLNRTEKGPTAAQSPVDGFLRLFLTRA